VNTFRYLLGKSYKLFITSLTGLAATLLLTQSTAYAHHSSAMFDHTKSVTITGVVKEVQWTNPHVAIFITGAVGTEEPALWLMEMTSPGNLVRDGWSRNSVKAGDKVTASFSPLRDTSKGKGGALKKIVLSDTGKALTTDIRAAERPNIDETPEK